LEKPPPFVKLGAVDSTNDFLREMSRDPEIENFTAVSAEEQTAGRGQRGASWHSEPGRNLILSVLVKDVISDVPMIFDLNVTVAVAIADVLERHEVPQLSIKWPNDMLSGNKKIGGILIENVIGSSIQSIVGIGINVNQENFDGLPNAGSVKIATGKTLDINSLAMEVVAEIRNRCKCLNGNAGALWQRYHQLLFRKGIESSFEDASGNRFFGVIRGVRRDGRLEILSGGALLAFGIREVRMIY